MAQVSQENPQHAPRSPGPDGQGTGQWDYGICYVCSSCDVALCCDVFCCAPCDISRIWSAVVERRPLSLHLPVCLCLYVIGYFKCFFCLMGFFYGLFPATGAMSTGSNWLSNLASGLLGLTACFLRRKVTAAMGIQEHPGMTCFYSCFCPGYSYCQMMKQLQGTQIPAGGQCCWRHRRAPDQDMTSQLQPGYDQPETGARKRGAVALVQTGCDTSDGHV
eukprot:TRINITY_DN2420_c0_g1_i2.p1 TRINITY_DN2420_c0_g1~~TRINITY_DN2420_c0_g1_i2.p1  ORF type:complete len:243 (+),score=38.87 TRINITY_DN2420_c0_g1_i2:75-731(+)